MNNCLIVCNGGLHKSIIQKFLKLNRPRKQFEIITADGASNFLYKHKVIPDCIIGDLDSISPAALRYFSNKKVKIKRIYNQYKNDFEKCILLALNMGYKKLYVIGLAGKRFDHTLNNLSILIKYSGKASIKCFDYKYEYYIMKKRAEFTCKVGEAVSLIALPKARGITTSGLKYPLKNGTLEFGGMQGALNTAVKKTASVEKKDAC
jgi:thiamine pyrophosphokinase